MDPPYPGLYSADDDDALKNDRSSCVERCNLKLLYQNVLVRIISYHVSLLQNANMYTRESLVFFPREHDIIKKGPEFFEKKGSV